MKCISDTKRATDPIFPKSAPAVPTVMFYESDFGHIEVRGFDNFTVNGHTHPKKSRAKRFYRNAEEAFRHAADLAELSKGRKITVRWLKEMARRAKLARRTRERRECRRCALEVALNEFAREVFLDGRLLKSVVVDSCGKDVVP